MAGLGMMGMGPPMKPKAKPMGESDADLAVKELIANPSAATFKAAMTLCDMEEDASELSAEE